MSITHLLDGTAQVWRRAPSKGATFREPLANLAVNGAPIACTVQVSRETVAPRSGGERPTGSYNVYADQGEDVVHRDILEFLTGPNLGLTLEVDHVYTPRGHHLEFVCREYDGTLP